MTRKIDMCAVVDLIKHHRINNVDQERLKMEENVFTIVHQMIQHFAELILKRHLLMKLLRVSVSKINFVLELQKLAQTAKRSAKAILDAPLLPRLQ